MPPSKQYANFQRYCEDQLKGGNSYASRFLKPGKSALTLALAEAKRQGLPTELINRVEERGMLDGSFELTYEGAERIYNRMKAMLTDTGRRVSKDYAGILQRFDPVRDSDLIATAALCLDPQIRQRVSDNWEKLYKVVLSAGVGKKKGYSLPERSERKTVSGTNFFPSHLNDLLAALPKPQTSEDTEYQRMLRVLIQKKAERDVFPAFKEGARAALSTLERLAKKEGNANIREAYQDLAATYREYLNLNLVGVNPEFTDPQTGKKDVLPSLHQRIAIYHILKERRFGIWDGGGTGKTAIAILAQPLIKQALEAEDKEFRRAIVVCPNVAKKAWRKGLVGSDTQRYLEDVPNVAIINGERKDKDFLRELAEKEWIVANYEQLTTKINGSGKLLIDALIEMGVDYAIFDESHNIKTLRERTLRGRPSHSAAARALALNAEYYVPMSATPISDGLWDFAVQYHLLNPVALPNPEDFMELIHNSPRMLYTFFNERSVRRTSEDINEDLDWAEKEHLVDLDPVQRQVYNHIVEFRPVGWLQQARKALIDPRLVDPEILQKAGVLGKVSWRNSAKYRKLEELITALDGPVAKGENFVVFSTMFREGVTQAGHEGLRQKYEEMGQGRLYHQLNLDKTLDVILEEALQRKYKKKYKMGVIDGTVVDVEERERTVDRLGKDLCGILCTTETGGESLDFTPANHEYFLDEDYVPDTEEQAVWRELRKGQRRKVYINHLRGKDTLDESNRDYVDHKRIIAKMAMDGVPPTQEEWDILGDTEGKKFGDLVRKSVGGVSIDVYKAGVEDISDFEVRKKVRTTRKGSSLSSTDYSTTDAQRVMRWIGVDPLGCWRDKEFVELYMKTLANLSPHVTHTAKICDLVGRSRRGEIEFPSRVISEGSGPSLLYNAYRNLSPVLKHYGFKVPTIVDRDTSKLMLKKGNNPHQVLGCMTGKDSAFKAGEFDMVDNESVTLLKKGEEVHSSLLEANRILRPNGLIELVIKNCRFSDEFYPGMERLGFEVLSEKNEGFAVGSDMFRRLKKQHGEHFAESYSHKLGDTYLLLARKKDKPGKANPKDFWFAPVVPDEVEEEEVRDPRESRSIIVPGRRGPRVGRNRSNGNGHIIVPEREYTVDRNGVVGRVRRVDGRN